MTKIIVSVTNDLTTDQRLAKVCDSLASTGYNVTLVGRKLKNSQPLSRTYKTKRFNLLFNSTFLFYANYNIRLFWFLLFSKKDILLANDLDTLPANFLVAKLQGKKLVYDSHELFTEVPELIYRKKIQHIWLQIEKWIFPKLKHCYTVNESIAAIYRKKYNVNVDIIKNYPTLKKIEKGNFPFDTENKKILFYQGALNVGRGLELLIDTVTLLENFILVIAGDGDITKDLKNKVIELKLSAKVFFLGRVSPIELQKLTPLSDIGFSLEEDLGLNYHFALPNKIFDYIQAEIPMIVSDLPEMKTIILEHNVGEVLLNRSPESLAKLIKKVIENDYETALQKAKKELTWNSEEKKLLEIFEKLT